MDGWRGYGRLIGTSARAQKGRQAATPRDHPYLEAPGNYVKRPLTPGRRRDLVGAANSGILSLRQFAMWEGPELRGPDGIESTRLAHVPWT